MKDKSDEPLDEPIEVIQDSHLLGVIFLLFYLTQIAWLLKTNIC